MRGTDWHSGTSLTAESWRRPLDAFNAGAPPLLACQVREVRFEAWLAECRRTPEFELVAHRARASGAIACLIFTATPTPQPSPTRARPGAATGTRAGSGHGPWAACRVRGQGRPVADDADGQLAEPDPAGGQLVRPRPPAGGPVPHSGLEPISCPGIALTQGYGPMDVVGEPIINGVRFHTDWDLACPAETPITSVTAGTVHVTLGYGGGFGNNVQVQVGNLWIRYGHLEAVLVGDGDVVMPGTVVGLEGSTGFSTGPHLHFEVDRGCPAVTCSIDPAGADLTAGWGVTHPAMAPD